MTSVISASKKIKPIDLLRRKNFFRVWLSGFLFGTTRWLEILSVSIFVFDHTGEALTVAVVMFLRMLPMLMFGAFAGAFAETVDGRKLLITGLLAVGIIYIILGCLAWMQLLQMWQLSLGAFLSGVFWTLEQTVRKIMVAELAGLENVSVSMGLDTATNNFTRILGPFFGGVLYQFFGLHGALALGGVLYFLSALLLSSIEYKRNFKNFKRSAILKNISDGILFAFSKRVILGAFWVTITFNIFGFACVSMVPVIASQSLGLSPFSIGLISSGEGFGAFMGSIMVAYFVVKNRFNQVYFFGACLYLVCLNVFSYSTNFWLSISVLVIGGVGMAGFSSMQASIIISNAPQQMRTRLMGVLTMCIGSGPIGILLVGLSANKFGADSAVFFVSLLGLIIIIVTGIIWPELLKVKKSQ